MKIVACITTRNEARSIGLLVGKLIAGDFDAVLVVDDASTDGTAEIAKNDGAMVFNNKRRLGMAASILLGWRLALSLDAGLVLQIDAGGSHNPVDAWKFISPGFAQPADLVIGSRFCKGARYVGRSWRAVMSRAAAVACNLAQPGARWSDWTSGYRAYSALALRVLTERAYRSRMHGFQIETLARAGAAGLSITEVPITYTAGESAFNSQIAAECFRAWWDVMRARLER